MKNRFRGLSESRKLEMLQMSVEEIYDAGYVAGYTKKALEKLQKEVKITEPKSPNQLRAELIQRVREFVEEHQKPLAGDAERTYGNEHCRHHYYETEFVTKKNRVTSIIHLTNWRGERLKTAALIGRANCAPDEVFNEWIGKAIALARALEIEIPKEFMDAVQPSHYAIGQIVKRRDDSFDHYRKYKVKKIGKAETLEPLWAFVGKSFCDTTTPLNYEDSHTKALQVIDDTNAEYPEVPSC